MRYALLALAVLMLGACATTVAPKTPMETLLYVESGVNAALTSATTLYQSGAISADDVRAVEKRTDDIDKVVMQASNLMSHDPRSCAWMFQVKAAPGQTIAAPTANQIKDCNDALQALMDAQQQLITLQQSLNAKKGGK